MNIDLHTHAKWSKSIDFSLDYYRSMMQSARNNGLDAVTLTEHFDTRKFGDIFDTLDMFYGGTEDFYVVEGVKVFPGMEVDVLEGGHILVIGRREAVTTVYSKLDHYTESGPYITLERLLALSGEYGCISIGAHPYREANPLHQVKPELLSRLDALDLNGRDLYRYGREMEDRVQELARLVGLPVVAGSDTHQPLQFGCVYNRFQQDCGSIEELREVLRNGAYSYCISTQFHLKVQQAEEEQARYKQQLRKAEEAKR